MLRVVSFPLCLTAFVGTVLMGCAAEKPSPDAALERHLAQIMSVGLRQAETYYLEPLSPRRAALDGISGLGELAPGFKLDAADPGLSAAEMFLGALRLDTLPLPKTDTSGAWGEFAARVTIHARRKVATLEGSDEEQLLEAFFDSVTDGLDRFSGYAGRGEAERNRAGREGYGGIGISLAPHPDGALVQAVSPDGPAAAAGILAGDRLLAVDTRPMAGRPVTEIERALRGPIDASVELTLERDGLGEPMALTVGRKRIVPDTVFLKTMGRVAIIRVSGFNQNTTKRVAETVAKARQKIGTGIAGLVIDLRGNPGGLLEEAIHTADLFLDSGLISRAAGRHPESQQRFDAERGDVAAGLPIAVLINGATASASEILAAALQDHGRAVIIGMSSFGKGSIQTVIDLPNGGELYLTWAKFVAPSGYALERMGVMPTICTSGASDAVTALDENLANETETRGRLARRRAVDASRDSRDAVRAVLALCPWNPHTTGDLDLAIAEVLLTSPAIYENAIAIGLPGASS